MNRAQRRAAARTKPQNGRTVGLPKILDEMSIFGQVERIFDQIATGTIDAAAGRPVYLTDDGEWSEICPALDGWISCWDRIARNCGVALDLEPQRRLLKKLDYGSPLTHGEIAQARAVVETQRKIFRTQNRNKLADLARTEQIAIYMEECKNGSQ